VLKKKFKPFLFLFLILLLFPIVWNLVSENHTVMDIKLNSRTPDSSFASALDEPNGDPSVSCALNAVVENLSLANPFAGPYGIAYDTSNQELYVTDLNSSSISIINATTNTLSSTISSLSSPTAIVYDPFSNEIYASGTNSLYVINANTNQLVTTITGLSLIHALAYDSSNHEIYAGTVQAPGVVYVISGTTLVATITAVQDDPRAVAYDSLNDRVYVGSFDSVEVDVIDPSTNTNVQNITNVADPYELLFDEANGGIYASSTNGLISIINGSTNTVVKNITLGGATSMSGMSFDPFNRDLYVANGGGPNTVAVINSSSNSKLKDITGVQPFSDGPNLAYDSANGNIYVANYAAGNIGVISTGCFVTFAEKGLPTGTSWSVSLDGFTHSLSTNSTLFVTSSGSMNWNVSSPLLNSGSVRYAAFPSSGVLDVTTSSTETMNYTKQYELSFSSSPTGAGTTEPSGTVWLNASSSVSISAAPSAGYVFRSWTVSNSSVSLANSSNRSTLATINGSADIRANFVTVSPTPTIGGLNLLLIGAGVAGVIVVALAVLFLRRRKKVPTVIVGPSS
jgi:YVTN family beta-propeller protein